MFKKIEDLSKPTLLNKSSIRELRLQASQNFPYFDQIADDVLPKKGQLQSYKLRSEHRQEIISVDSDVIFFTKEDVIAPHLRLVHKYPDMLPRMQIDKGGLKFIYEGANVMCPGLTSPGGIIAEDVKVGDIVAIYVEGKTHAMAVGICVMSSTQMKEINKGIAIQTLHYLNDALWDFKKK